MDFQFGEDLFDRVEVWHGGHCRATLRMCITPHAMGSLEEQLNQIADSRSRTLMVDTKAFLMRGGELFARGGVESS